MKQRRTGSILLLLLTLALSCKKDTPAAPPTEKPPTIGDYYTYLRLTDYLSSLPEISTTDFFLKPGYQWNPATPFEKNAFIWFIDIFDNSGYAADWETPCALVKKADSILKVVAATLAENETDKTQWQQLRGRALFLRAYALYHLTQLFAPPYSSTAATDLGIPLQITAPTEMKRATLQTTYRAIIDSLKQAIPLLSYKVTDNRSASAPAANALLARIFLSMADYTNAAYHCEKVFYDYDTLVDYNTVDTSNSQLFLYAPNNREILFNSAFYSDMLGRLRYSSDYMSVDTTLYQQYSSSDLRKNLLFHNNTSKGVIDLKAGGYSDFYDKFFCGLALDEVYLIAAECAARKVNIDYAMALLNTLLESRYKKGTFTQLTATTSQQALELVLNERRKELVFRGLRWYDLRRLNRDGANITLKRMYNGNLLTLAPNSLLYTFPIPNYIVRQSNGSMVQNPRY